MWADVGFCTSIALEYLTTSSMRISVDMYGGGVDRVENFSVTCHQQHVSYLREGF